MLLTPGKPRTGPEWLVEAKLDGARALARVAGGEVTIQSRPGNSFTARFPEIADALACQFDGHTVIVDGELVALDAAGLPNFALLQRRLLTHKPTALHRRTIPARLWLFDCLHLDGHDLTALPYRTRREVLEDLVPSRSGTLAVAPAWSDLDAAALIEITAEMGIEGTVSKRADSLYRPGRRTRDWIKSPVRHRRPLLCAGFYRGRTMPIGALILAGHDPITGKLRYAGTVSAGLGAHVSRKLADQFRDMHAPTPPWAHRSARAGDGSGNAVWLRPACAAAVEYREFTTGGRFRHLSFKHLLDTSQIDLDWLPLPPLPPPASTAS